MMRRTAVFPSHGMVDEKISVAKENFELVPLEPGETANVVGLRVYVGPLRNLDKSFEGKDLVCHDVSFLDGMGYETWTWPSDFSLTTPTWQKWST